MVQDQIQVDSSGLIGALIPFATPDQVEFSELLLGSGSFNQPEPFLMGPYDRSMVPYERDGSGCLRHIHCLKGHRHLTVACKGPVFRFHAT